MLGLRTNNPLIFLHNRFLAQKWRIHTSLIYQVLLGCTPCDRLQINGQLIQDMGLKICGMYNRAIAFDRGMRSVGVLIVGVAKRSCYL
jgi:hypothetical protein